ncbi:MAG: AIM24 family protein, partial [Pricia sp.]
FVHAGGTLAKKQLAAGEVLKVDTGCIVGFTQSVDYDIEFVGGIKNTIFGGEGLFFATLKGPGTVYIQSLPFSRLAGRVLAAIPRGGKDKGEGSILGGLGDILGGDNRF